MKKSILFIFIFFIGSMIYAQTIATNGKYQYTLNDFEKAVNFTEFICGAKLTSTELGKLKQQEIIDFNENPEFSLQNIADIDYQMQQFYAITDPSQIGLSRSMLIANLYYSIQEMPDDNAFKQIFNSYNIVLAIDPYNGISLTQKDVDSYFDYLTFYANLMGQAYVYDQQTRQANTQGIINQFLYGENQTKLMLSIMTIYYEYIQSAYNQLSYQEKQQFASSMTNNYDAFQQGYDYSNSNANNYYNQGNSNSSGNDYQTQQMYFNTMQDMMMQENATSLNIIENIGGSGNYWEVIDY